MYQNKMLILLLITLSFLSLISTVFNYAQDTIERIIIDIEPTGLVNVTIFIILSEGINEIILPIEPIASTILVFGDTQSIPPIYYNGSLYLYLNKKIDVVINYIANVTIVNNIFYLYIKTEDVVELRIPKNIVLLTWPEENLVDIDIVQETLILYIKGQIDIKYTLSTPIISTTPPSSESITITSPYSTTQFYSSPLPTISQANNSITPGYGQNNRIPFPWTIVVLILVIVIISTCLGLYIFFTKRRSTPVAHMLSDIDFEIIKALEARGGSALQAELQNDVRIPRTTLWRHVKKLEKLGIVRIEKIGLQNRVVLLKKVRSS